MPALSENGWFPDKFRVLDRLRYVFHLAGLFSTSEVIDLVTEYDLLTDAYAESRTPKLEFYWAYYEFALRMTLFSISLAGRC